MASAEREPKTGPRGPGGIAPGQGVRGVAPLKLVTFLYWRCISCALVIAFCSNIGY